MVRNTATGLFLSVLRYCDIFTVPLAYSMSAATGDRSMNSTTIAQPRGVAVILVVLIATFVAPPPTHALVAGNQGLQYGAVIDNAGNILFNDEVAAKIAASGAGWIRINFRLGNGYFLDWTDMAQHGYSALSRYDTIVATARNHQLKILGELSNEAWNGWLSLWQANNAEAAGGTGDNAYIQDFSQKAALVLVQHFAGQIDTWEIWNEPNQPATYLYPSNFAHLLAHVYSATRAAGITTATFVSGGITSMQDSAGKITSVSSGADYLSQTYTQGKQLAGWNTIRTNTGSYPLDRIGQHIYIDGYAKTTAAKIRTSLKFIRDVYVQGEGGNTTKKTVITEFGWSTKNVSEKIQADNLQTAYTEYRQTSYLQNAYWFFLRDELGSGLYFGLLRPDSSQKPSWSAYQTYANY
jgi:hypothetical protein